MNFPSVEASQFAAARQPASAHWRSAMPQHEPSGSPSTLLTGEARLHCTVCTISSSAWAGQRRQIFAPRSPFCSMNALPRCTQGCSGAAGRLRARGAREARAQRTPARTAQAQHWTDWERAWAIPSLTRWQTCRRGAPPAPAAPTRAGEPESRGVRAPPASVVLRNTRRRRQAPADALRHAIRSVWGMRRRGGAGVRAQAARVCAARLAFTPSSSFCAPRTSSSSRSRPASCRR